MRIQSQATDGRVKVLSIAALVIMAVFALRLFDLQVTQHSHYLSLAQRQQQFEKNEIAHRGEIFVHDSAYDPNQYYPLAFDVKKFSVLVVPGQIKDKHKFAKEVSSLLSLDESDLFGKINNNKVYIPPVKKGLTLEQARELDKRKFPGIYLTPEYNRFYPEGTLASRILGFVNAEGKGNYGFEGKFDEVLKGKEGSITGEKDTLGRIISLIDQREPENGTSFVLTIDRGVQYFVEKKLSEAIAKYRAQAGEVIIIDIKTGGVLAMASLPSFDPNNYKETANIDPALFTNPLLSHTYEPGSTLKTIIMSGAIDQGVVTPETTGVFEATTEVMGYTVRTAERKAFGEETMTQVLENSDNVAMTWLSEKMGKEMMYDYLTKFGFNQKTGVMLEGETVGRLPALKEWREINRATISFGQGISVTPIQLVTAYAAIANKGVYLKPQIIDKTIYSNGETKKTERQEGERVISEETANTIMTMLKSVVDNGHKKAGVKGFSVGVKTGTAQIADPNGGYLPDATIHSTAGIAPIEDPRYAMLVRFDRPTSYPFSSGTAAPFFGEISSYLLNYYYRLTPAE